MKLSLYKILFLTDLKKAFTYRIEFFGSFFFGLIAQFTISCFLWDALFSVNNVNMLKGYSFEYLIFYSLLVPLLLRILQGESIGCISREIYEGGLTKFLIYPVNFFTYKFTTYLSASFFYLIQSIFIVFIASLFKRSLGIDISVMSILSFIILTINALITYFLLTCCIELITFWAEKTWTLMVMLRLIILYLGGGMMPIDFFPETIQILLKILPFYNMIQGPISCAMNFSYENAYSCFINLLIWNFLLLLLARNIWKRGIRIYQGVGI